MDRPDFSIPVADGGYAWWYVDALSDDGRFGITVIAFVGSVFSPYYARARRQAGRHGGTSDPENHVAINVAVYRPGGKRWAMTERDRSGLTRTTDGLQVGGSSLQWTREGLTVHLAETAVPWPTPVTGHIRLTPIWRNGTEIRLDAGGSHRWQPFAPRARVEVRLTHPSLRWTGHGYLDGNVGDGPLSDAFDGWHWSRAAGAVHTTITYDLLPRRGAARGLAFLASEHLGLQETDGGARLDLPPTGWRVRRRAPAGTALVRTLEDTPFYARSEIAVAVLDQRHRGVHESLDLTRLRQPWVNLLLPFRMPRRTGRLIPGARHRS